MAVSLRYKLPTAAEIRQIRRAVGKGVPEIEIATKLFGASSQVRLVRLVLTEAELYDTCLDEIAVERALKGDLDVWERLTHYERREVLLRSQSVSPEIRRLWGFAHHSEWSSARCTMARYHRG